LQQRVEDGILGAFYVNLEHDGLAPVAKALEEGRGIDGGGWARSSEEFCSDSLGPRPLLPTASVV
jgi:hypothetical protein